MAEAKGGGGGGKGKIMDWVKLVGGIVVVVLIVGFVMNSCDRRVVNTGPQNFNRLVAPGLHRDNYKREEFYAGCDAHGAPVTQLSHGRLNCHREPTITTREW